MLLSLCLVLPACAVSIPSDKLAVASPRPQLAQPDSALTSDCPRPVDTGYAPLSQARTEKLWINDRKALIECGAGRAALRDFYRERDAGLTGAAK